MSSLCARSEKLPTTDRNCYLLLRRSQARVLLAIDLGSFDKAKYHTGGNGSVNGSVNGSCTF